MLCASILNLQKLLSNDSTSKLVVATWACKCPCGWPTAGNSVAAVQCHCCVVGGYTACGIPFVWSVNGNGN